MSQLQKLQKRTVAALPGYLGGGGAVGLSGGTKWPAIQGSQPSFPGYTVEVPALDYARLLLDLRSLGTALETGLSIRKRPSITHMLDLLFWANGIDDVRYFDGDSVYTLGITRPAAAPTFSDQGTGSFEGTYTYAVRWYNSTTGEVSGFSDADVHTASGSDSVIRVFWTDPSITGVDKAQIFRSFDGQPGPIFKIATVDIDIEEWDDSTDDDDIDITFVNPNRPVPGEDTTIPTFDFVEAHNGRLWGVTKSDNRLYWSEPNNPWYIPGDSYMPVQPNDGDTITAIKGIGDYLYVFKRRHTYVMTNVDVTPGLGGGLVLLPVLTSTDSNTGAANENAIVKAENTLVFFSGEGKIYQLVGGQPAQEITPKIEGTLLDIFTKRLEEVDGVYDELARKIYFTCTVGDFPANNRVLVLDLVNAGWTFDSRPVEAMGILRDSDGVDKPIFGDVQGVLSQLGVGYAHSARLGTTSGDVTSATKNTMTDDDAEFVAAQIGQPITLINSVNEVVETSWVAAVPSGTQVKLRFPWTTTPDSNYSYVVGGSFPYWKTGWMDFGMGGEWKNIKFITIGFKPTGGNLGIWVATDEGDLSYHGYIDLSSNVDGKVTVPLFRGGSKHQFKLQMLDGAQELKLHYLDLDIEMSGRNIG